jgi:hypothetical protein
MLTSPTWTRSLTSSTRNQALVLGICSISDDPSSKEDILCHLPLRKMLKKMAPPRTTSIHQARTAHIFGVLLSIVLFMYHFVNTECMKIALSGHEL